MFSSISFPFVDVVVVVESDAQQFFTKSRQTQHNETMTIQDKTMGEVSLLFNRLCSVCRTMKLTLCQSLEVT